MATQKYHVGDLVRILPFEEIDTEDVGGYYSSTSCFGIPRETINEHAQNLNGIMLAVCDVYNLPSGTVYYHLRMKNCANTSIGFEWAQGMICPFEDEPLYDADPEDLVRFLTM